MHVYILINVLYIIGEKWRSAQIYSVSSSTKGSLVRPGDHWSDQGSLVRLGIFGPSMGSLIRPGDLCTDQEISDPTRGSLIWRGASLVKPQAHLPCGLYCCTYNPCSNHLHTSTSFMLSVHILINIYALLYSFESFGPTIIHLHIYGHFPGVPQLSHLQYRIYYVGLDVCLHINKSFYTSPHLVRP